MTPSCHLSSRHPEPLPQLFGKHAYFECHRKGNVSMLLNSGTLSKGVLFTPHLCSLPWEPGLEHTLNPEAPLLPHRLGACRTLQQKTEPAVYVAAFCFSQEQRVLLILVSLSEGLSARAVLSPHPQETLGNVWAHVGLSQLGRGCPWHLEGGGQGCCSTLHRAQGTPAPTTQRMLWVKGQQCRGREAGPGPDS